MSSKTPLRSFSNFKDSVSSSGSFRSMGSSSSISRLGSLIDTKEEFKENKACCICQEKFSFTLRRHHCRLCKESVCDDHSIIRYVREGKAKKLRICDKCDRKCIKEELQDSILNEINSLQQQISIATELNSTLYKEKFERTTNIHNLQMRLHQTEIELKRKEEELENRLKEETELNYKAKARIDDFMKKLTELNESDKEITARLDVETDNLKKLKENKGNLEKNKEELEKKLNEFKEKLKDVYQIDELKQMACEDCCRKLTVLQKPRMSFLNK